MNDTHAHFLVDAASLPAEARREAVHIAAAMMRDGVDKETSVRIAIARAASWWASLAPRRRQQPRA